MGEWIKKNYKSLYMQLELMLHILKNYIGSVEQNLLMLQLLNEGKLIVA